MDMVICGLAVYKAVQILDALSPREAMPWVKVVVGTLLAYGAGFVIGIEDLEIQGLAIATVAGAVHTLLRFFTLVGDRSRKPTR